MKYIELRKILENFPKYPGTKKVKPASVVNKGFPGKFNLSFSEPDQIKEFNSLLNYDHDFIFTKIQPVIRHEDFSNEIIPATTKYKDYLSLFDMSDITSGITLHNNSKLEKVVKFITESTWNFFIKEMGFDPNKLYVKVFAGGSVEKVSQSKYLIKKDIKPDELSIKEWQKLGLKKSNLIFDKTRDTLLTLHVGQPTPWGYRCEILFDVDINDKKELLDIGTTEFFYWRPIFENDEIVNIKNWESLFALSVVGVERILMAKNKFRRIIECDHIYPLYQKILKDSSKKDEHKITILTEAIRTTHRVLTDCKAYSNLSVHRKKILAKYIQQINRCLKELDISQDKIKNYLKLNAKLQSVYPELSKSINSVNEEILDALRRRS
ncbi:hypothetical protein ACFL24_01225 [Patescibacteria group bacterium]